MTCLIERVLIGAKMKLHKFDDKGNIIYKKYCKIVAVYFIVYIKAWPLKCLDPITDKTCVKYFVNFIISISILKASLLAKIPDQIFFN